MDTNIQNETLPFGMKDKVGYMFGDVGTTFIMGVVASFAAMYYTNVLGISAGIAGGIISIATIFGAFSDVIVGRLADTRELTSEGRFHPWIRIMKWPLAVSMLLIFLPGISNLPLSIRIIYTLITHLLYIACLSGFNIPYGSLASAISSDSDERTSLSVFRSVGSAVGAGGTGAILPLVVYSQAADGSQILSNNKLFMSAIVCAGLALIAYTFMYNMTTERVQVEKNEKIKVNELIKALAKNKPLLSFLVAEITIVITTSLSGFMMSYLFTVYFQNNKALSVALLFNYANVLVLSPIAKKLSAKFGKKEISSVALLVSSFLYLGMYLMKIENPWIYLVLLFCSTLCFSMFNIMVWAFITDIIDYQQYSSGLREDGTVYSVNMFGRKIAQTVANSLGGGLLALIGYVSSNTGSTVQSQEVLDGIYALANLLPAILLFIGALLLAFWYPLSKTKIDEVTDTLKEVNN